jgi:hypothetical protein
MPGFLISQQTQTSKNEFSTKHHQKHMVVYTPKNASGNVSLVNTPNSETPRVINENLAFLPPNSIIDAIEYKGYKNFAVSGEFDIGLGQLNTGIFNFLVENGTSTIANAPVGGYRDFVSSNATGANDKIIVQSNRCINIATEHPVTSGGLIVTIYYHSRENTNRQ